MAIVLSEGLKQRLFTHLEASYPNEGGGFLLGVVQGEDVTITDTIPVDNVFAEEEQYHRYAMTPQDWIRLEDTAEERGLSLVGYYHSHPDDVAVPSVYDRDHALPNFVYLITSVQQGKAVDIRGWALRDDRSEFDPHTLKFDA
jgi:proteasome lid subunit RPN8/RPN11